MRWLLILLLSASCFAQSYKVNLTWSGPCVKGTLPYCSYLVFRANGVAPAKANIKLYGYTQIGRVAVPAFTDKKVLDGYTYTWMVMTLQNGKHSAPSNAFSIPIP